MSDVNWFDLVPATMSAVASIAAAIAAFGAVRVSRESKQIAEQSALAMHHADAARVLSEEVRLLISNTNEFSELAYSIWADWAREIEFQDNREAGGSNPRPLRHVLSDASEMLVTHGASKHKEYGPTAREMFAIVRDGIGNLNDAEYKKMLRIADGTISNFEGTFGATSVHNKISDAPAFRWAIYQLNKRIRPEVWCEIWLNAWHQDGWLGKYRTSHSSLKQLLESAITSLESERAKLAHTVLPLSANASLASKYDLTLDISKTLLDLCSLELVEHYSDDTHKDDVIQLILYSMGMAYLVVEMRNSLESGARPR